MQVTSIERCVQVNYPMNRQEVWFEVELHSCEGNVFSARVDCWEGDLFLSRVCKLGAQWWDEWTEVEKGQFRSVVLDAIESNWRRPLLDRRPELLLGTCSYMKYSAPKASSGSIG